MNKKRIIVVDVDDTIAQKTTRHKYDWSKLNEDVPILSTLRILDAYLEYFSMVKVIILTARNEGYPNPLKKRPDLINYNTIGRELTEAWVKENVGEVERVIMKSADSFEKSSTFKVRMIQDLLNEGYEIDFIMDDNADVISAVKEAFPTIPLIQIANY